jgi:hypothetical protein
MSTDFRAAPTAGLLTADDLRHRWGLESTDLVWDAVGDAGHPLPYLPLGKGRVRPGEGGQRGAIRFRLADVERWEAERVRTIAPPAEREPKEPPSPILEGWDGKVRGGRRDRHGRARP